MISILIPAYNENPVGLCKKLEDFSRDIPGFEILVGDDHSAEPIKDALSREDLQKTRVIRNEKNLGYNLNRNNLAKKAANEILIFMDSDVMPAKSSFIYNYYSEFEKSSTQFVCGGMEYGARPEDPKLLLKWIHGKEREQLVAKDRRKTPGRSITTSNLAVRRSLFLENPFLEMKTGYGYNDTVYGLRIESLGFQISHIDNPIVHLGLIPADELIERARQASLNLKLLSELSDYSPLLAKIKIFSAYKKMRQSGLLGLIHKVLKNREKKLRKNLLSTEPELKNYDQLRLLFLISAMKEN